MGLLNLSTGSRANTGEGDQEIVDAERDFSLRPDSSAFALETSSIQTDVIHETRLLPNSIKGGFLSKENKINIYITFISKISESLGLNQIVLFSLFIYYSVLGVDLPTSVQSTGIRKMK